MSEDKNTDPKHTMSEQQSPDVYAAISRVQQALATEGISKSRTNEQQKYKFRGIDDVYNAVAGILPVASLIVIPKILSHESEERESKNGGRVEYATVVCEFMFISTRDGSSISTVTIGKAMDSADKAMNKAMSAAMKYAMLMTFTIPTEGDNDADATTHEVKAKPTPVAPADPFADWVTKLRLTADQKAVIRGLANSDKDKYKELLQEAFEAGCTTSATVIEYLEGNPFANE